MPKSRTRVKRAKYKGVMSGGAVTRKNGKNLYKNFTRGTLGLKRK